MNLRWRGSSEELNLRLGQLPFVLAGRAPDPGGATRLVLLAMGMALLARIKINFQNCSTGSANELGPAWPPLAATTLALRRMVSGPATMKRLRDRYNAMSPEQQKQVDAHAARLIRLYHGQDRKERAAASRILEKKLQAGTITAAQYRKKKAQLSKPLNIVEASKLALVGSHAMILRDTGRLLNSLTPGYSGADQIFRTGAGWLEVGSNVMTDSGLPLLALHTSKEPRQKKADGSDKLPRRKVLPESVLDMPASWLQDMVDAAKKVMASREFWQAFLGPMAG